MTVLDEILEGVRADLADRQRRVSLEQLKDMARRAPSPRDALAALKADGVGVIAEVKRASPSARRDGRHRRPGRAGGATTRPAAPRVISVLTEQRRFGGSLDDLAAVRRAGADPGAAQGLRGQLLPALGGPRLRRRPGAADRGRARAERAGLAGGAGACRSACCRWSRCTPTTSSTARSTPAPPSSGSTPATWPRWRSTGVSSPGWRRGSPRAIVKIAESGVRGPHDLLAYAAAGADAVLVGESLVTEKDPRAAVADLVTAGSHPALRGERGQAER